MADETFEKTACDALKADGFAAGVTLTDEDLADATGGSAYRKAVVDANPYVAHDVAGNIIRRGATYTATDDDSAADGLVNLIRR